MELVAPVRIVTASPAPAASRPLAFKSGGEKMQQVIELLNVLCGETDISLEEISAPSTPVMNEHAAPTKTEAQSNLPMAALERWVAPKKIPPHFLIISMDTVCIIVSIKEMLSISSVHEGGAKLLELCGEMNL